MEEKILRRRKEAVYRPSTLNLGGNDGEESSSPFAAATPSLLYPKLLYPSIFRGI